LCKKGVFCRHLEGSGAISQRHGSADPDPDPPQNVTDPQHWLEVWKRLLVIYTGI